MRGVKKRQRAEVEFLDELQYLCGPNAASPDLFVERWNLAQHFNLHFSNTRIHHGAIWVMVLVKAGIPQMEWNRERPA